MLLGTWLRFERSDARLWQYTGPAQSCYTSPVAEEWAVAGRRDRGGHAKGPGAARSHDLAAPGPSPLRSGLAGAPYPDLSAP